MRNSVLGIALLCAQAVLAVGGTWRIDEKTGAIASFGDEKGRPVVTAYENRYLMLSKAGDAEGLERDDVVVSRGRKGPAEEYRCTNPKLPGIEIVKRYWTEGKSLSRQLVFTNTGDQSRYVAPFTDCHFDGAFQKGMWHFGSGYLGPYKPFPDPRPAAPYPINAHRQSSKGMVFTHPDGSRDGYCHYRTKIDGTVVLPWWHSTIGRYREYHDRLWFLPDGYRLCLGTFGLYKGRPVAVTDRFACFAGEMFAFFDNVFAKDPDFAAELKSIPAPLPWLRDAFAVGGPDFDDFYARWLVEMSDEGAIIPFLDHNVDVWGDCRCANGFPSGKPGCMRVSGKELRDYVTGMRAVSPRLHPCIYHLIISASDYADVVREHPEWYRKLDRDGNRDSLFPGFAHNWQTMFNYPDCRDWYVDTLCRFADDVGEDILYLDETQMTNTIDWQRDVITRDDDTVRFWQKFIRRMHKEGKAFFANGSGIPYADLNYMESPFEMHPDRWRDWVGVAWGIGMMNRMRPGQRTCPLFWINDLDYENRALCLGWIPRPMGQVRSLPILRAAYQSGNMFPVDAAYSPDWKKDAAVEVESHAVRRDDAKDVLLSFINRAKQPADVPVTVELGSLGFGGNERVNVWRLHLDAKLAGTNDLEYLSDRELKAAWREEGVVERARITDPELVYSGPAKGPFSCTVGKLAAVRGMEQFLVTASPASLYAENGLPLTYFYTAQKGARIDGRTAKIERDADILLIDAQKDFTEITANGRPVAVRRVRVGDKIGTLVSLSRGTWTLGWREVPRKAGGAERAELPVAPKTRRTTKVRPPQAESIPAECRETATNVVHGAVTVTKTAVFNSSCEKENNLQKDLPVAVHVADAQTLRIVAGTSRRQAQVRWLESFAGLEMMGAKSVRLKLAHSFAKAFSCTLGHTYPWNAGTPKEFFAGLLVDYSVGGRYVRRVSMSVGLYNRDYLIPRPAWGTGRKPDRCLDFGDWIEDDGKSREFSLDFARFAPEGWDGRVFLSVGTSHVKPNRVIGCEILAFNEPELKNELVPVERVETRTMPPPLLSKPLKVKPKSLKRIDAAEWRNWAKADGFYRLGSGKVKAQTTVYVAHDYEYLYLGYDVEEKDHGPVLSCDDPVMNDHVEAFVLRPDTVMYQAVADAKGRKSFYLGGKWSPASRFEVRTEIVPQKGWRVFFAIPVDDLKFDMQRTPVTVKMEFARLRTEPYEISAWTPLKEQFSEKAAYGTVVLDFNW